MKAVTSSDRWQSAIVRQNNEKINNRIVFILAQRLSRFDRESKTIDSIVRDILGNI